MDNIGLSPWPCAWVVSTIARLGAPVSLMKGEIVDPLVGTWYCSVAKTVDDDDEVARIMEERG